MYIYMYMHTYICIYCIYVYEYVDARQVVRGGPALLLLLPEGGPARHRHHDEPAE